MAGSGELAQYLRQLQGGDWLGPLYSRSLAADAEPERWEAPALFVRPSQAGVPCSREAELYLLGHRERFEGPQVERMANGNQVHRRVQRRFKRMGVLSPEGAEFRLRIFADGHVHKGRLYAGEKKALETDHGPVIWSGQPDLLVRRPGAPASARPILGEIKSANTYRFRKLPKQHEDPVVMARLLLGLADRFIPQYVRQVVQYATRFAEAGLPLDDNIFFFFENTDTQAYRVIWIRADAQIREDAGRNATLATAAAARGELLDPPFKRNGTVCSACPVARVCYDLQDGSEDTWDRVRQALAETSRMRTTTATTEI